MADIDLRFIRHGIWTNHEQGSVMGRTITTDTQTGAIVVALLALLGSLAMSHLWNIVVFISHQLRADGKAADGLFRQQQIILRATPAPGTFLVDWFNLFWHWRGKTRGAFARSIPHFSLAVLAATGFIVVGTFSSYVVDGSNLQVLVRSDQCARLELLEADSDPNLAAALNKYSTKVLSRSTSLTQDCWQDAISLPTQCHSFVRPNVPLKTTKVDCPFGELCHAGNHGVSTDSGLVDLRQVVGWNLDERDRVDYRRKLTCGVLQQNERQQVINASDFPVAQARKPFPGEELILSYYGDIFGIESDVQNVRKAA
jgi:hypothetical protein